MRFLLKLPTIGILMRHNDVTLSLHLPILPISQVVFLPVFMLDPLKVVSIAEIVEI